MYHVNPARRFCSDECREGHGRNQPCAHTCDVCGVTFTSGLRDAKYCSPLCRQSGSRAARKAPSTL
jgi:hypothetical protein